MEYLMVVWFLFFPFCAMGVYYFSYKQEVNEELQELKYKYEMNQLESTLRLESYKLKLEAMENEHKYYHDLKTHLQVLNGLYNSGNLDKAKEYMDNLIGKIPATEYIISHELLNIVFSDLKQECKNKDIKLIMKINRRIAFDGMDDIDLVVIFSNIIRNALEAVKHCNQKEIHIEINKVHNFIVSIIRNTYNNELLVKDNIYKSTKNEYRGYGISNVVDTIEKYNGTYLIENENNIFVFQVVLPIL